MKKKYYLYEMDSIFLNVISFILLFIMLVITYFLFLETNKIEVTELLGWTMIIIVPYMILNLFLHGISFALHGANMKNITFGIFLEKGIMRCSCKQNIKKANILISLLYPFILIGVIAYIIGIYYNNPILIALSIINISGCAKDLILFFALIQIKKFEYSDYDNPISFAIYSDEILSNRKILGIKYVGWQEKIDRIDYKKMSISSASIFLSILFIIAGIVYLII